MKDAFRRTLLVVSVFLTLGVSLAPALASADVKDDITSGVNTASGGSGGGQDLGTTVHNIISILGVVVGIVAVIVIIIAGLNFITAGGDAGKVARARAMILYAVVGLIIAALAEIIVRYVLNQTN